jgi:hypothetical protein
VFHEAGRYVTCAFGGNAAFSFFMVGRKVLHAGQPYENTSITSTLPGPTVVRWACGNTL